MRVELRVVVEDGVVTGVVCSNGHTVDLQDEQAVVWTWPRQEMRDGVVRQEIYCGTHLCNVGGPSGSRGGDHVKLRIVMPGGWGA